VKKKKVPFGKRDFAGGVIIRVLRWSDSGLTAKPSVFPKIATGKQEGQSQTEM
jgi:hypothetical protein